MEEIVCFSVPEERLTPLSGSNILFSSKLDGLVIDNEAIPSHLVRWQQQLLSLRVVQYPFSSYNTHSRPGLQRGNDSGNINKLPAAF